MLVRQNLLRKTLSDRNTIYKSCKFRTPFAISQGKRLVGADQTPSRSLTEQTRSDPVPVLDIRPMPIIMPAMVDSAFEIILRTILITFILSPVDPFYELPGRISLMVGRIASGQRHLTRPSPSYVSFSNTQRLSTMQLNDIQSLSDVSGPAISLPTTTPKTVSVSTDPISALPTFSTASLRVSASKIETPEPTVTNVYQTLHVTPDPIRPEQLLTAYVVLGIGMALLVLVLLCIVLMARKVVTAFRSNTSQTGDSRDEEPPHRPSRSSSDEEILALLRDTLDRIRSLEGFRADSVNTSSVLKEVCDSVQGIKHFHKTEIEIRSALQGILDRLKTLERGRDQVHEDLEAQTSTPPPLAFPSNISERMKDRLWVASITDKDVPSYSQQEFCRVRVLANYLKLSLEDHMRDTTIAAENVSSELDRMRAHLAKAEAVTQSGEAFERLSDLESMVQDQGDQNERVMAQLLERLSAFETQSKRSAARLAIIESRLQQRKVRPRTAWHSQSTWVVKRQAKHRFLGQLYHGSNSHPAHIADSSSPAAVGPGSSSPSLSAEVIPPHITHQPHQPHNFPMEANTTLTKDAVVPIDPAPHETALHGTPSKDSDSSLSSTVPEAFRLDISHSPISSPQLPQDNVGHTVSSPQPLSVPSPISGPLDAPESLPGEVPQQAPILPPLECSTVVGGLVKAIVSPALSPGISHSSEETGSSHLFPSETTTIKPVGPDSSLSPSPRAESLPISVSSNVAAKVTPLMSPSIAATIPLPLSPPLASAIPLPPSPITASPDPLEHSSSSRSSSPCQGPDTAMRQSSASKSSRRVRFSSPVEVAAGGTSSSDLFTSQTAEIRPEMVPLPPELPGKEIAKTNGGPEMPAEPTEPMESMKESRSLTEPSLPAFQEAIHSGQGTEDSNIWGSSIISVPESSFHAAENNFPTGNQPLASFQIDLTVPMPMNANSPLSLPQEMQGVETLQSQVSPMQNSPVEPMEGIEEGHTPPPGTWSLQAEESGFEISDDSGAGTHPMQGLEDRWEQSMQNPVDQDLAMQDAEPLPRSAQASEAVPERETIDNLATSHIPGLGHLGPRGERKIAKPKSRLAKYGRDRKISCPLPPSDLSPAPAHVSAAESGTVSAGKTASRMSLHNETVSTATTPASFLSAEPLRAVQPEPQSAIASASTKVEMDAEVLKPVLTQPGCNLKGCYRPEFHRHNDDTYYARGWHGIWVCAFCEMDNDHLCIEDGRIGWEWECAAVPGCKIQTKHEHAEAEMDAQEPAPYSPPYSLSPPPSRSPSYSPPSPSKFRHGWANSDHHGNDEGEDAALGSSWKGKEKVMDLYAPQSITEALPLTHQDSVALANIPSIETDPPANLHDSGYSGGHQDSDSESEDVEFETVIENPHAGRNADSDESDTENQYSDVSIGDDSEEEEDEEYDDENADDDENEREEEEEEEEQPEATDSVLGGQDMPNVAASNNPAKNKSHGFLPQPSWHLEPDVEISYSDSDE